MASAASNLAASIASKTKTKKKHFVSQKVKLFRASDPLLSVLMWGVNHSVRLTFSYRFITAAMLLLRGLKARVAVFLRLLDPSITVALTSFYDSKHQRYLLRSILFLRHATQL